MCMSDDVFPKQPQSSTSISQVRRRVNPDSLAVRLGPDLVRDMEALIVPGNIKMPSFAIRKELQERYNVDRRPIYDYFHSRGLRVAKEEKRHKSRLRPPHCNNKPATLLNTRRRTSRGITKASRENTPIAVGCSKIAPMISINTRQQEQLAENQLVALRLYHTRVCLEEPESCALHSVITNPADEPFSVTPDAGDLVFRHRPYDYNFEANGQTLTAAPIQQECNATLLFPASTNTVFFTHARPLSSAERQAIYEALADSLGPACGIQECVGTYRRHMQDRSRLYYESAHPVDKPLLPSYLNWTPAPETNEFRFWLSSGEILGSEQIYPTRSKHDIQKMVMKQREDRLSHECRVPIGSDQPFAQTLDDLFPTPPTDTRHVMESPVVRSGQFAVAFPFYALVPEVERELPREDRQTEDQFGYYASSIHDFTSVTNQQNANIPFEAVEAESFRSIPMSLAPCANDHSINTLSDANRGISSTSECHVRRKGRLDRTEARFATFNQCRSPLRERHGMQTRSTTSRGESRRRATASAGGGI